MGLYDDLITDITAAFDDDLSDAVKDITIIEFGDPVYDPITGTNTPIETSYPTRGVVTSLSQEDIKDKPTLKNGVSVLILDSEKKVTEFKNGSKILIETYPQAYKLNFHDQDPANVSHTIMCGRWS